MAGSQAQPFGAMCIPLQPRAATDVCSVKSRRDDLIIAQYGLAHTSCTQLERRYSAEPVLGTMGQEDQSRKGRLIHLLLSLPSTVPIAGLFGQHFPTGEDGGFYSYSGQASRTGYLGRGIQKISDGTRDPAMIQPSLTGLVHALFATQHCVLGYYQAVPAGLHATNSCRSSGGRGMHIVPNGCGCDPAMLLTSFAFPTERVRWSSPK